MHVRSSRGSGPFAIRGRTLTQLGIGEVQVSFVFHPEGTISVEGAWELRDAAGSVIDQSIPNDERSVYRLHCLLGSDVVSWQIDPPISFSLSFSSGLVLRIFDDSKQYESFSIHPGDIYV